jgi:hypothetical protein
VAASAGGKEGIFGRMRSGNVLFALLIFAETGRVSPRFRNLQCCGLLVTLLTMSKWDYGQKRVFARLCTCAVVVGAVLCTNWIGNAQEPAVDDFATLKQEFSASLEKKLAPQVERYIRKLAELKQQCAEKRDFALAGRISVEYREAVDQWYEITGQKRGVIELKLLTAKVAGGVRFDKETEALIGWGKPESKVECGLPPGIQAGAYTITVRYTLDGKPADVVFGDGHYLLNRKFVTSNGVEKKQVFMALLLSNDAERLSIECSGKEARGLRVHSVKLEQLKAR